MDSNIKKSDIMLIGCDMMNKLNNKGFAISTMLYGLLIVLILVITTLMGIMSFNRNNSKEFTDVVINELEGTK